MKPVPRWFVSGLILLMGLPCSARDQVINAVSLPDRPLIVATKAAPPFAFKTPEGEWSGMSIELWEELASDLELDFNYVELTLPEILDRVEKGTVDAGVSALTITPDRESRLDFTYPYYNGGLGIAVSADRDSVLVGLFKRLVSWDFLRALAALSGVLFVAAFLVWIFERRANPDQFGGSHLQGLWASFWWSAVTMTTVGYGDKAPKSPGGRAVALIWMFASILIISSFTAGIASSLTAGQMAADYLRSKPIDGLVVATVEGSTGEEFARKMGLRFSSFPDALSALAAVHEEKAEAIIYDLPLLKFHLMQHHEADVEILPRVLLRESYAIALPEGSPLREALNRRLVEALTSPEWLAVRRQYLGGQ